MKSSVEKVGLVKKSEVDSFHHLSTIHNHENNVAFRNKRQTECATKKNMVLLLDGLQLFRGTPDLPAPPKARDPVLTVTF